MTSLIGTISIAIPPCEARKHVEECSMSQFCAETTSACKAYSHWLGSKLSNVQGSVRLELRAKDIKPLEKYERSKDFD